MSTLTDKNKSVTEQLEKKKREAVLLKRQVSILKAKDGVQGLKAKAQPAHVEEQIYAVPKKHPRPETTETPRKPVGSAAPSQAETNAFEIAKKYKARLDVAEEQLNRLRDENASLRAGTHAPLPVPPTTDLQSRDLQWRLQQLQTQYDHAMAKNNAQSEAYKLAEEQIEEYAQRVRELRRALEDLRHEKDICDIKANRVDDLEDQVMEMRQANRSLEDKIARLCEAPFISDAFGQHDARLGLEEAARDREEYRQKIDHLQEAVKTHYSALVTLNQQAEQLRQEKLAAEQEANDLRAKYAELEMGTSLLQDKLRLYSGEDGVNLEDLERALTVVKRRGEAATKLDFLENPDGDDAFTLPQVTRKLENLQVMNLSLMKEVERLEGMLKMQSKTNKDLHKELEMMVHKKDKDQRDAAQRTEEFEELALRRLHKIHSLEAQLRQLVYDVEKKNKKGRKLVSDAIPDNETVVSEQENALLSALIDEKNGNVEPDDNMLEVWIKGATIKDGVVAAGSSTFIVVDFFDYESQATGLLPGNKPTWDFAVSFKIKVDDFMIRHLATDVMTFELNLASQGDFTMLARCTVPLSPLLKSKPIIRLKNQPMLSVGTGEIIAHVQLDVKLALPLSELYRLYLERHPEERKHIEEIASKRAIENANATEKAKLIDALAVASVEDESRLFNELEVAIFNITSLPKGKGGVLPTPYVHFQLLGHPDKFTNPVADTIDPSFNERFIFPMLTNEQQLRLLRRSNILLSVIDMKGEEQDDDSDGLLGEVNVSLSCLAEGIPVNDSFHIKNPDGKIVGTLRMSLRWKNTFRKPRELGPKALSGLEVECLISAFAPGDEKDGLVDYRSFMRFANPPAQIRTTIDKIRVFITTMVEREGLTAREVLQSITKNAPRLDEESFLQSFVRLDIPLLPEDYLQIFEYIDMDKTNSISVDQIVAVLNMDEVAGIPASLQEKLSIRMRNLESRGIDPISIFEDADQWGDRGMLTRLEFKRALHSAGFMLVDEPGFGENQDILSEPLRDSRKKPADQYDLLNDSMSSTEGDLLMHSEGAAARSGFNREHVEMERKRREMFEEKLAEVQKRSRDATKTRESKSASSTVAASAALDSEPDAAPAAVVGKNILAEPSPRASRQRHAQVDPYVTKEHRTSLSHRDTPIKGYDRSVLEASATKLQSRFRGYATRKKLSPEERKAPASSVPPRPYVPGIASRPSREEELKISIPGKAISFADAESTLRHCLETLEGGQPMPNLFGMFQTVDAKQLSYVNRKQFAYVIRQFDSLKPLTPEELRVFMDYFDMSEDGSKIDYVAFCRFSLYKPIDMIPPVRNLQRIVFTPDSILKFRAHDNTGSGYLSRQDMLAALSELGHGHFSQAQALAMLSLFETKADGLVNYSNFVEYVRSADLSLLFDQADNRLRSIIAGTGNDEGNIRRWFRRLDRTGVGIISPDDIAEVFAEHDLKYPLHVIAALLGYMDHNQNGVSYTEFAAWYKNPPKAHAALYSSLSLAEVQKKAALYIRLLTQYNEASVGSLSQGFLIYDWQKPPSGMVGKNEFCRAVFRSGFVFTPTELRMLSKEFSSETNPNRVVYKDFLTWCIPSDSSASLRRSVKGMTHRASRRNASQIISHLETMLRRGTDLLSVFGRYDSTGVGRITSDEFCAALSDLGLSSITQAEALEAADTFKAAAGGYVLYRRVVTELLNQMDYATKASEIDAIDIIRAKLLKHDVRIEQLRDVFEYYDRKHIGRIPESDLGIVFEECHLYFKRHELQAIMDRFCVAESGWVQYLSLLSALEARMNRTALASVGGIEGIPEDLANRFSAMLESMILRGKDFRAEFDSLDDNFMGAILQSDFRDLLQDRFRASFTERDLETLEKHYRDASDPRKVNHVRLLHELHPRNAGSLSSDALHVLQVADILRQKIRKRCDYLVPGELRRPYRHFARRKVDSGFTREDLMIGLKDLGIQLAGDQEKQLFALMSYDNNDKVTFNMFVVFVCDPFHQDVIWKLRREIARARISDTEIIDALDGQDTNASGLITSKQFARAMKSCNISLSDNDVTRLMYRFDDAESQRFDIEKFTKFLRGQPEDGKVGRDDMSVRSSRESRHGDVEGVETRVVTSLKNRIEDKLDTGYTHAEVFELFDVDAKGIVDLMCLQRGARELGVNMSRAEARAVLRRLTLNAGGPVDKLSFFDSLGVALGSIPTSSKRRSRRQNDSDEDGAEVRRSNRREPTGSIRRILASIRREVRMF